MDLQWGRSDPAPGATTDEALVRRCAAGETAAFRELFDRYEPLLMRFFIQALGDREDAEEAVVDTFLKLWRGAPAYRGEAAVRTWLYRIANSTAIDALRRRSRQPAVEANVILFDDRDARLEATPDWVDPAAALVAGYQRERDRRALSRALARLAPSERVLLVLFYYEGYSYAQIGEITGTPLPRLKGLLYRARQRLKGHFERLRHTDEDLDVLADPATDSAVDTGQMLDR
jgi:RNA polymerase sigma-70 factor (ECF subfamily)